ncbi:hypothetical protein Pan216_00770 [Planctomycetes bacterium Pan216]|uniref:Uncharacterized protein n=1 Tax=Kolteria novifilia TaxID=2527975 RepID=A0A518AWY8_9BACT|nr:hypothetical protein Pan216_00770 [Planctomycetes bacterium Pan216]
MVTTETTAAQEVASKAGQATFFQRWWRGLLIVGTLSTAVVVLLTLVWFQPPFYADRVSEKDAAKRRELSRRFLSSGSRLFSDIQNSRVWSADFTEEQINAWLAEDFESNLAAYTLPSGVSKPRVAIQGDQIQVGFRYQRGPLATIVHFSARAWVPQRNVLALELSGAKAGALPLPASHTRQVVETIALTNGVEVTWKRNGRRLVALFRFPRNPEHVVLLKLQIEGNQVALEGTSGRGDFQSTDYAPTAN